MCAMLKGLLGRVVLLPTHPPEERVFSVPDFVSGAVLHPFFVGVALFVDSSFLQHFQSYGIGMEI